jgi:hypothetical protein
MAITHLTFRRMRQKQKGSGFTAATTNSEILH